MPTRKSPRKGSLQYWPRKRAKKFLPRVNWDIIKTDSKGIKGYIGYKAGMKTAIVKDLTEDSMTKGKEISIPVTILECPNMKILSTRFYSKNKVVGEVLNQKIDKKIKSKIKLPKKYNQKIDDFKKEYDDLTILVYSNVKKISFKNTPDIIEVGLSGTKEEKLEFIKENLEKEISLNDVLENEKLVDGRGLTKGKGTQGPVKRFGITLKVKKSEKGQRRPGNVGPWHPARVTFRIPMAGQLGMFSRIVYNNSILEIGNNEKREIKNIKNYGDIKTSYIILAGSIQGPAKRQILLTKSYRPTKKQNKKNYEIKKII